MTQKANTLSTEDQNEAIKRLFLGVGKDVVRGLNKDEVQKFLGRGEDFKRDLLVYAQLFARFYATVHEILVVPDMPAEDLTACAIRDLKLTYVKPYFTQWDYYKGIDHNSISGRGKKFEVLVVPRNEIEFSDDCVSSEVIRAYFSRLGFVGHVGAFIQWLRQHPEIIGFYTSIPQDSACWRYHDGRLCVPSAYFFLKSRQLDLDVDIGWGSDYSFVGFREIST